ncbi:MAG: hypothetical protein Q9227_003490 [Pyrenula ochraceoflavens]
MTSTPPLRSSVRTPATPRHGPMHDNYDDLSLPSRFSSRLANKRQARDNHSTPAQDRSTSRSARGAPLSTPTSSRRSSRASFTHHPSPPHSAHFSPEKKSTHRARISSPNPSSSPTLAELAPTAPVPSDPTKPSQTKFLSAGTMGTGMLPTPIKTPKKKTVPDVNATARALFRDQPVLGEEVAPSSRKGRQARKYNGFSLESFSADDNDGQSQIRIFTDSKEKVPELDMSEENPFVDRRHVSQPSTKKVTAPSKRRKVSAQQQSNQEVEEALDKDSVVYVFRGKKIVKKLPEESEESEETDLAGLDITQTFNSSDAPAPLRKVRPLTRRSIKPTRLFQTEKRIRDEKAAKEDEIVTDLEEDLSDTLVKAPEDKGNEDGATTSASTRTSPRSKSKKTHAVEEDCEKTSKAARQPKQEASPFDSWKRVKSSHSAPSKGKKRDSDHFASGEEASSKKKLKSR